MFAGTISKVPENATKQAASLRQADQPGSIASKQPPSDKQTSQVALQASSLRQTSRPARWHCKQAASVRQADQPGSIASKQPPSDKQADSNQPGSIACKQPPSEEQTSQVALHAGSLSQTSRMTATSHR
jgi:hypothetical protein